MANPIECLHNLFTAWNTPGVSAESAREDPSLTDHIRAVRYLGNIKTILDRMDQQGLRTGVYRRYYQQWVNIVFNYPHSWSNTSTGAIDSVAIDMLENLIAHAEQHTVHADEEQFEQVKQYLSHVTRLLREEEGGILPQWILHEAYSVIGHIRNCMDDIEVVSDLDFEASYQRLLGCLIQVSTLSRRDAVKKTIFDGFVWPFMMGVASSWTVGALPPLLSGELPELPGQ